MEYMIIIVYFDFKLQVSTASSPPVAASRGGRNTGSLDLPQEELRKQYKHLTFRQNTEIMQGKEPSDKPTNKPVEQLLRET